MIAILSRLFGVGGGVMKLTLYMFDRRQFFACFAVNLDNSVFGAVVPRNVGDEIVVFIGRIVLIPANGARRRFQHWHWISIRATPSCVGA